MITLTVNGEHRQFATAITLAGILSDLGISPSVIVAELNGDIVRRDNFSEHELSDGDVLELVAIVGGG